MNFFHKNFFVCSTMTTFTVIVKNEAMKFQQLNLK